MRAQVASSHIQLNMANNKIAQLEGKVGSCDAAMKVLAGMLAEMGLAVENLKAHGGGVKARPNRTAVVPDVFRAPLTETEAMAELETRIKSVEVGLKKATMTSDKAEEAANRSQTVVDEVLRIAEDAKAAAQEAEYLAEACGGNADQAAAIYAKALEEDVKSPRAKDAPNEAVGLDLTEKEGLLKDVDERVGGLLKESLDRERKTMEAFGNELQMEVRKEVASNLNKIDAMMEDLEHLKSSASVLGGTQPVNDEPNIQGLQMNIRMKEKIDAALDASENNTTLLEYVQKRVEALESSQEAKGTADVRNETGGGDKELEAVIRKVVKEGTLDPQVSDYLLHPNPVKSGGGGLLSTAESENCILEKIAALDARVEKFEVVLPHKTSLHAVESPGIKSDSSLPQQDVNSLTEWLGAVSVQVMGLEGGLKEMENEIKSHGSMQASELNLSVEAQASCHRLSTLSHDLYTKVANISTPQPYPQPYY